MERRLERLERRLEGWERRLEGRDRRMERNKSGWRGEDYRRGGWR